MSTKDYFRSPGVETQKQTLLKIIRASENTKFGQLHNFKEIHTIEDYRKNVPLMTYSDHLPWIDRIFQENESDVLFPGLPSWFAKTSGTTGQNKYIPKLDHVFLDQIFCLESQMDESEFYYLGINFLPPSPQGLETSFVSSYAIRHFTSSPEFCKSSPTIVYTESFIGIPATYLHCLFALHRKDLKSIFCGFITYAIGIFNFIIQNFHQLREDIANGTATGPLTPEQREKIAPYLLGKNPVRASELLQNFSEGKLNFTEIWPDLVQIQCVCGGPFVVYENQLRNILPTLGTEVHLRCPVYGASEGLYAWNVWPVGENHYRFVFLPQHNFYEFVPHSENFTEITDFSGVEVGQVYEFIVTTMEGMYRYRTGDLIRIVDFYGEGHIPVMEFVGRVVSEINILGAKIPESSILESILLSLKTVLPGSTLIDFVVIPNISVGTHFDVMIEVDQSLSPEDSIKLSRQLSKEGEDYLQNCCPIYKFSRLVSQKLECLMIKLVPVGTFDLLKERLSKRSGGNENQVKIPRVFAFPEDVTWINSLCADVSR
eukprot:TRINITY_DN12063_c0_g1_i4.p1 TRINITY_DN12063_c0_g1~~TRINITY_DN12063_c0_g1_i4.p1  ORF type:complete len:543 (-),score=100.47 TRINITY_DN12063_c0_g1_i4:93-1721(-)